MTVQIGDQAPDFELTDQSGRAVRLADYRGEKHVLLVFYPLSFTGVCEGEMCGIRDSLEVFHNDVVETLAVSVDSPPTHARWAHEQGFSFPLLSDFWPHGEVARAYGVFDDERGVAVRGTFLIDIDGTVVYAERNPGHQARDQDAWRKALADLGAL